jgi:aspartyl protease family protein
MTTVSSATARAASVELSGGFPVVVETANGIAEVQRARVETLAIGPIVQSDAPVHVSDGLGDTNLLGMSFLSKLKSWRVEGRTLILEP